MACVATRQGHLLSPLSRGGNRHGEVSDTVSKQARLHLKPASVSSPLLQTGKEPVAVPAPPATVLTTITAVTAVALRLTRRGWAASSGLTFDSPPDQGHIHGTDGKFSPDAKTGVNRLKGPKSERLKRLQTPRAEPLGNQLPNAAHFINFSLSLIPQHLHQQAPSSKPQPKTRGGRCGGGGAARAAGHSGGRALLSVTQLHKHGRRLPPQPGRQSRNPEFRNAEANT